MLNGPFPVGRWITLAIALAMVGLLLYGLFTNDPITYALIGVILIFVGAPALVIFFASRNERLHAHRSPIEIDGLEQASLADLIGDEADDDPGDSDDDDPPDEPLPIRPPLRPQASPRFPTDGRVPPLSRDSLN